MLLVVTSSLVRRRTQDSSDQMNSNEDSGNYESDATLAETNIVPRCPCTIRKVSSKYKTST